VRVLLLLIVVDAAELLFLLVRVVARSLIEVMWLLG